MTFEPALGKSDSYLGNLALGWVSPSTLPPADAGFLSESTYAARRRNDEARRNNFQFLNAHGEIAPLYVGAAENITLDKWYVPFQLPPSLFTPRESLSRKFITPGVMPELYVGLPDLVVQRWSRQLEGGMSYGGPI